MLEDYDEVTSSTSLDEFIEYHDDPDNFRENEAGFNAMYDILSKYGSEDEDVDVVFERASDADKKAMLDLIRPY